MFLLIFEKGGERETDLLFHLSMHLLADPCMCPDHRQNPALKYQDNALTEPQGLGLNNRLCFFLRLFIYF